MHLFFLYQTDLLALFYETDPVIDGRIFSFFFFSVSSVEKCLLEKSQ